MTNVTVTEKVAKWLQHQKNFIELFTDIQSETDLSDKEFEKMVEIDKMISIRLHESIYQSTVKQDEETQSALDLRNE